MQFQYNSDYPGLRGGNADGAEMSSSDNRNKSSNTPICYTPVAAAAPLEFPPAHPITCARITTRVYHPARQQVATVQNVLVATGGSSRPFHGSDTAAQNGNGRRNNHAIGAVAASSSQTHLVSLSDQEDQRVCHDDAMSSSSSSLETSESSMMTDDDDDNNHHDSEDDIHGHQAPQRAYWLQRTIRDAIYGRVVFALVLIPMKQQHTPQGDDSHATLQADWMVTTQQVAVKELSWQHIRRERDRLAEDPITEVAAMQYLMDMMIVNEHHGDEHGQTMSSSGNKSIGSSSNNNNINSVAPYGDGDIHSQNHHQSNNNVSNASTAVYDSFKAVLQTNIMMPLDLLSDDRHLYSVMPYCNGGELFERLDLNEKFSEEEARYWMAQILNGVETLQHAGICHRDISLENLLVHESGALIIDLGMCLRIPHYDDDTSKQLTTEMQNMSMETSQDDVLAGNSGSSDSSKLTIRSHRQRPRYLIQPQGTCGKWIYMSPEIYKNSEPFDGYAVDMWAAGVILFLMLTGFPPWERACMSDERFKYMTAGYLVQMLTEWNLGLSADAMDLLQRMLFLDPKDRLSLDQVRHHPWMVSGFQTPPPR